jgi:hypothetical protein
MLVLLFLLFVSQYKDKFEKKIVSTYEPSKLHYARAFLMPVVYVAFTALFVLKSYSLTSFLMPTLYQVGYFLFYYDETVMMVRNEQVPEMCVIKADG